jgi:Spy/CpxP family protein refolding chaperone
MFLLAVSLAAFGRRTEAQSMASTTGTAAAARMPGPTAGPFDGIALSDAQRAALRGLSERTRAARAAILRRQAQRGRLSPADRNALMQLAAAHDAAIRDVLSPTQRDQLTANVQAEQERRQRERQGSSSHTSAPSVPTHD